MYQMIQSCSQSNDDMPRNIILPVESHLYELLNRYIYRNRSSTRLLS